MSEHALERNPRYKQEILDGYVAAERNYQAELAKSKSDPSKSAPRAPWKPTELYNGMISPLIPYTIKGAIWYQGESNAGRAEQYRTLFPDMIRSWREDWCQGNFTFLAVQLAPFMAIKDQPADSAWAELREAQLYATKVLPKVGMAEARRLRKPNTFGLGPSGSWAVFGLRLAPSFHSALNCIEGNPFDVAALCCSWCSLSV